MSRETLLDDAIAKAKEAEDWQLVEWLRMARGGESAARWYTTKLREASRAERKLLDENAKLRELCADLYAEMITYSNAPNYNASVWAPKLRELGVTDHDGRP